MQKSPEGYLLVNKPLGWTSFDVVNKIRFMLADELQVAPKSLKVGHAGTLDPMAGGLLIVLVGLYTKRQSDFMKQDKTYDAELELGKTSNTDDAEGQLKKVSDRRPSLDDITSTLQEFIGSFKQVPPDYSAIKIRGRPAYSRARSGEKPKLTAKPVRVLSITGVEYQYPKIKFTCVVSSGTYIRALVRDVGQKLGTGAYLTALVRTKIGKYSLKSGFSIADLEEKNIVDCLKLES